MKKMNVGIILAAGSSKRFKSQIHKQYLKLNGKEVIYYTISEMRAAECFDKIIAVVDQEEYVDGHIAEKYDLICVEGGTTRNKSIKNALDFVKENYPADNVVFHDCIRPFIKRDLYRKFISLLETKDGVAMTTAITDSLVTPDGKFVDRRKFNLIQTPEAFKFEVLYQDFDENSINTAIINQLRDSREILLYKDNSFNFKITYPEDLFLAEQLMRIDYFRTSHQRALPAKKIDKVLLLGGSGGVGTAVRKRLDELGSSYYAPSHSELDLYRLTVNDLRNKVPFKPEVIINVAAAYADDESGLIETYEKIFDVGLKSNLVLIEYAKTLDQRVNMVVMSSSSSTRGREHLTNYSAAKAALNSIVESQGHKLAEKNIYLNAIIPEKIKTPLIGKLHKTPINERELLDVNEVIDAVVVYASADTYGKLVHIRKGL